MRFKTFLLLIALFSFSAVFVAAQNGVAAAENKDDKKDQNQKVNLSKEETDGIRIAESSILVYSGLRGREGIDQIRKTTVEIGEMTITGSDGKTNKADYERRILRGDNLGEEKIRLDQKFPNAEYALIYDGEKVFGVLGNTVFSPRADTVNSFQDLVFHGLEALLRYRENGSKVELEKEMKDMGVDYYVVNVTDKQNRQTTFYISKKSLRIMKLEYESDGIKYHRKFYNHNYAQGTLVPYRSVLWADGKQVEEKKISTITFGQTVNEGLFKVANP